MVIFFVKKHTSNDIFKLRKVSFAERRSKQPWGQIFSRCIVLKCQKGSLGCFTMLYILCGKANPVIKWIGDRQDQFAERAACYS